MFRRIFIPGKNKSRLKMGFPAFGSVPGKNGKEGFLPRRKMDGSRNVSGGRSV
jgi:hypothetical protein